MPYLSGSSARDRATSSLAAASRNVSHAPSLETSKKVLFLYARRLPLESRFSMNWDTFSGTCSSEGIAWPSRGFRTAIFRPISSVILLGSSGKIWTKKWPFPFVMNSSCSFS